jgi:enamine deaminase RidA (YjgF/YER057c/UK114 family)
VGADFSRVFKVVTYVVDLTREKAAAVRAVRMKYLGHGPYPASTMVGVTSLVDPDFLIEIEVIALLD